MKRKCNGIIPEFAPEVWPILVTVAIEPEIICRLLGYCPKSSLQQQQQKEEEIISSLHLPPVPSLPSTVPSARSSDAVNHFFAVVPHDSQSYHSQ